MAATIARLARMANVFTAYVNLNVELASSRAGEPVLVCSGLYLQPLFHSPVLCSPPAVFVFTLVVLSPSPIPPLSPKPKRNLLALICYTLACPASFSPLPTFLFPLPFAYSLLPFALSSIFVRLCAFPLWHFHFALSQKTRRAKIKRNIPALPTSNSYSCSLTRLSRRLCLCLCLCRRLCLRLWQCLSRLLSLPVSVCL